MGIYSFWLWWLLYTNQRYNKSIPPISLTLFFFFFFSYIIYKHTLCHLTSCALLRLAARVTADTFYPHYIRQRPKKKKKWEEVRVRETNFLSRGFTCVYADSPDRTVHWQIRMTHLCSRCKATRDQCCDFYLFIFFQYSLLSLSLFRAYICINNIPRWLIEMDM